jgi:hypothetical protein
MPMTAYADDSIDASVSRRRNFANSNKMHVLPRNDTPSAAVEIVDGYLGATDTDGKYRNC